MVKSGRGILSSGYDPYGLTSLISSLAARDAALTPEEREARRIRREILADQSRRRGSITSNICPDCKGKLVRGKKDKKLGYRRLWSCSACNSQFTDNGDNIQMLTATER